MDRNLYSSRLVRSLKLSSLACLAIILFSCFTANAQYKRSNGGLTYGGGSNGGGDDGWGISLSAGYDKPLGDLGTTFKGAPAFAISVIHNLSDFTFNATIGYVSYSPKEDTTFFDPADHTQGYIKYGNFSSLEFFAGVAYNVEFADQAKFYFGFDVGSYYNSFSYDGTDGDGETAASTNGEQSYIAPKLGFKFMMSDNISLGIEGKYNFLLSSSSGTGDAYDAGYATTVSKSISGSLVLTYNF